MTRTPSHLEHAMPNVVVCVCDQLRAFEVGAYGNAFVRTPNLDAFAAGGTRFDLAVTNNPVCCPARASLLSGQHARTCSGGGLPEQWEGVEFGVGPQPADWPAPGRRWFPDPTIAEILRERGYETALVGKWHVDADPQSLGFDYALYPAEFERYYGQSYREGTREPFVEGGFGPDFELDAVKRYLARRDDSRPLFLYHNITLPHMPLGPGNVPPEYGALYRPEDVPLRDNVWIDGELPYDEQWFKTYMIWDHFPRWLEGKADGASDALPAGFDLRDLAAAYCAATTCTDDLFGRLLAILDDAGVTDNAVVVFTSDHGELLGSHHLFNKGRLLEEAIRIPLLVRAPGVAPGVDTSHVAQLIDLLPTVLDLCGLAVPEHVEGRSLAAAVRDGEAAGAAEAAFIETFASEIGIRTDTHLVGMTLAPDLRTIADERYCAYDLASDPLQLRNLVDDPAQQVWQEQLRARLIAWHRTTPRMPGGSRRGISDAPEHPTATVGPSASTK